MSTDLASVPSNALGVVHWPAAVPGVVAGEAAISAERVSGPAEMPSACAALQQAMAFGTRAREMYDRPAS
jgi:hypothetical protein